MTAEQEIKTETDVTPDDLDAPLTAEAAAENAAAAEDTGAAPEGFWPDTEKKADWVLCKMADLRDRAKRIRENAETMAKQAENDAAFLELRFGQALQDFARKELAGSHRKSLPLYHGTLGWRTHPARVVIAGDKDAEAAAALQWAKDNLPEAVCVKETLDRRAVLGLVGDRLQADGERVIDTATGAVLSFATVQPAEEKFYIK